MSGLWQRPYTRQGCQVLFHAHGSLDEILEDLIAGLLCPREGLKELALAILFFL